MLIFKNVQVIGENEIFAAEVAVENGKITEIAEKIDASQGDEVIDGKGKYLSPGFIDLHVHGGGGYSAMGGKDAVIKMCEAHARFGTTSILPTTLAAPIEQLKTAIYLARLGIAGLLQAKDLVPSQELHNQVVEILSTSSYHHLLRGHVNTPELAQIAHNGLA